AGREAHNRLLAAERLFAGLSLQSGFEDYPQQTFTEAWKANCWPDHGWGGNQGIITDSVYNASYEKSKKLADQLLNNAGSRLGKTIQKQPGNGIPLVVFNPLNWERTDVVHARLQMPSGWQGVTLRDEAGREVPCEISAKQEGDTATEVVFVAERVPSLGYRSYAMEPASSAASVTTLSGRRVENQFFKVVFGDGGIKSLYDKRLTWDALRTEKFDGGEVVQFTAPGVAWEDPEIVTMENFDKTSRHPFPFKTFTKGPARITALREAAFKHFLLRENFHLYHALDRVEIDLALVNWDGQKDRELRVVFPVNLDDARTSYEVPFGAVEMGKDELDFTLLPPDSDTAFRPDIYGGDHPLAYREAINWVDASAQRYLGHGCLSASDMTVHLFRDETDHPVSYPILQHVLLSTRKSLAWNPDYWFTQAGTHRYRMALLPHKGDWRLRYREAIAFNYPLFAVVGDQGAPAHPAGDRAASSFFQLQPSNLVLTALKKSEDDNRLVIRFYEAEGFETPASIRFAKPITHAWKASLIEDDGEPMQTLADGSLQFSVKPWEIVTLKVAV
ncbi:MAG TPA: glycosyl hydrolase-related protein, partial [Terriglobia bacterium]|nr:glycosyl hydrolase-related protein [Terriglobia bacterium]